MQYGVSAAGPSGQSGVAVSRPRSGHVVAAEYVLRPDETIISKTDLRGNVTYANDNFVRISGYSRDELVGSPQSIERHPYMPRQVFEDLWATLKEGKAWGGMIKNRCRNGDEYWVLAFVAPIVKDGQATGYTSIRVKPPEAALRATQALYDRLNAGDTSVVLRNGVPTPTSFGARVKRFFNFSLKAKFNLLALLITAVLGNGVVEVLLNDNPAEVLFILPGWMLIMLGLYALRRSVITPLKEATEFLGSLSSGNLYDRIPARGDDELGQVSQWLRILQVNIKLLVGQIQESTRQVNESSSRIAQGNTELAARTEAQSASLQQTAAAMDEITSTVVSNADNAASASDLVHRTSDVARDGRAAVSQVTAVMDDIYEGSRKITDIIAVIDSIAFQTNILALNAAVEAARAGEQGRGFAVVAGEVRALAQRSATAAKEIKELIVTSSGNVEKAHGSVRDAERTMSDILDSADKAAQLMTDIANASREQSVGVSQVSTAIAHLDELNSQNEAQVDAVADTSQGMLRQAQVLVDLVSEFKVVAPTR